MTVEEQALEDGGVRFVIEITEAEKTNLCLKPLSSPEKVDLICGVLCGLSGKIEVKEGHTVWRDCEFPSDNQINLTHIK